MINKYETLDVLSCQKHGIFGGRKYIRWSDVTVIYGDGHDSRYDLYVVGQHGVGSYCVKLSGEDLSRYSNKIVSVGFRKRLCYHYLTNKYY